LFLVCLLFTFIDLVLLKTDSSNGLTNETPPNLRLSVYPNAGISTENIEIRCDISQPLSISPLSSLKSDNIYLSVKTDNVKPSGIVLMFEDDNDQCHTNRGRDIDIDVCNASLILIHINHTVLNETLQKIDYLCSKGSATANSSYEIISKDFVLPFTKKKFYFYLEDQSARYYDPIYNSSSPLTYTLFLLLFVFFMKIITEIRWS
jgi:hypothetical protein